MKKTLVMLSLVLAACGGAKEEAAPAADTTAMMAPAMDSTAMAMPVDSMVTDSMKADSTMAGDTAAKM